MAEYLIQGETLTGIADKIRPLLGLTGTMTTDQMQTNLTTEQANITAALAALTEKGVEVPEGANSNALAGLIEAIEAGGGDFSLSQPPLGFTKGASGSFVVEQDELASSHNIDLGFDFDIEKPVLAMVFSNDLEKTYSTSNKTLQFLLAYDQNVQSVYDYKQAFGACSYTGTTGSPTCVGSGALGYGGDVIVKHASSYTNSMVVSVSAVVNNKVVHTKFYVKSDRNNEYYMAGKQYYWMFLGTEVI